MVSGVSPSEQSSSHRRHRLGPLDHFLVASPRFDDDISVVTDLFDWNVQPTRLLGADAADWGVPSAAERRSAMATPSSGRMAGIRFVETDRDAPPPFRTPGWSAIEVLVDDLDQVVAALDADPRVQVVGQPSSVGEVSRPDGSLRAAQVLLPGGSAVYLTEIRGTIGAFELPASVPADTATAMVHGAFIAVLAATDLEISRRFVIDHLGGAQVTDHGLAVGVLNRAFALQATTRHRVSSVQLNGSTAIEIDQLPESGSLRRSSDELAAGIIGVAVIGPQPTLVRGPDSIRLRILADA